MFLYDNQKGTTAQIISYKTVSVKYKNMYLIGYDVGSSSVKASIVEVSGGTVVAEDFYPKSEMPIAAPQAGWAEQDPCVWWDNLLLAHRSVMHASGIDPSKVKAVGISCQMHGLILVDRDMELLRPSIIWCDSRAVPYGEKALDGIGKERLLPHTLNSPGNFTAAKLAWVKDNEPRIYERIHKFMFPGDYIGMRMTGEICTTVEGLSGGILWDFRRNKLSDDVMDYFGFDPSLVPDIVPVFGIQGGLSRAAAKELGLKEGTPVAYRAGDMPNTALSLNVLHAGEVAATAGTSGVVYGISEQVCYDPLSRLNTFAHVNHTDAHTSLGVLLCLNGAGILNSWLRHNVALSEMSYDDMNRLAGDSPIGAGGISILPFGNGAERMLGNRDTGCSVHGVNYNIHTRGDLFRAAQEGIAFSFKYGIDIMREIGLSVRVIRAGCANMFQSALFRQALADLNDAVIELYDTNGAAGAARGAGIGIGIYKSPEEAFGSLRKIAVIEPDIENKARYLEAYSRWKAFL